MFEIENRRALGIILTLAVAAAGACARGEQPQPEGGEVSAAASSEAARGGDGVPDACAVFAPSDVEATLGAPGEGTPAGGGSRSICRWANGTIVGVSEANQYDGSVALARQSAECKDVDGVGNRAVFCVTGGAVGQLMWVDGGL